MDSLELRHLAKLAASGLPEPQEVLREVADKYARRNLLAAKGFGVITGTILTTFVIPWTGRPTTNPDFLAATFFAAATFLGAVVFFLRARQYAILYVDALHLLCRLQRLTRILGRPLVLALLDP